jgi:hypothetical protein
VFTSSEQLVAGDVGSRVTRGNHRITGMETPRHPSSLRGDPPYPFPGHIHHPGRSCYATVNCRQELAQPIHSGPQWHAAALAAARVSTAPQGSIRRGWWGRRYLVAPPSTVALSNHGCAPNTTRRGTPPQTNDVCKLSIFWGIRNLVAAYVKPRRGGAL